jgi:large subunit ribosomal protein L9
MQVILTQSVAGVGKAGESHKVADGYGRNYLVPRKLAVEATKGNLRNLEKIQADSMEREAEQRSAAEKVYAAVDGQRLLMPARVSADGNKLYGSVTAQDIADALGALTSQEIDKRSVLTAALKRVGTVRVPVRVYAGLTANIDVVVYPEGQQPPAKEEPKPEEPEMEATPGPVIGESAAPVAEAIVENETEAVADEQTSLPDA